MILRAFLEKLATFLLDCKGAIIAFENVVFELSLTAVQCKNLNENELR